MDQKKQIKLTAELVYRPDRSRYPGLSLEEVAELEMDHAPDRLIQSEDTVYRYEIVPDGAPNGAPAEQAMDPAARRQMLVAQLEAIVAELQEVWER